MKINLIIPSFYPATVYGGPIFSTLHTCKALSKLENIEVFVSTTNANRDNKLDVEVKKWIKFENNFFVKYYNETKIDRISFSLLFNVWRDIKKSDVVHLQGIFSTPTPMVLLYAKVLQKPIVLSPRGSFCSWCLEQGSRFKKLWMRFIISPIGNSIYWHATSEAEKEDILKLFPKSEVFVIPNGIDIEAFSKVNFLEKESFCKKYIGKKLNPSKIIVSMGRLHKVKGFDILINSFSEVLKSYEDAILCIAGKDVGEQGSLEVLVKKLNLENSVFFVGEVSNQDKIDFLGNADLFVLASHTENFGNVYVESLASGTPIVATTGTPWEEVESFNCGKWVENSVNEITNSIFEMLKKEQILTQVNSQKLAKKYDWETIAIEFKNTYEILKKETTK
jgi:glycosyltransferase involved in cell wall biosynthesis